MSRLRGGRPELLPPLAAWWGARSGRRHEGSAAPSERSGSDRWAWGPSGVEQLGRRRGVGVTDHSEPMGAEPAWEHMGVQLPGLHGQSLAVCEVPVAVDVDLDIDAGRDLAVVLQMQAGIVESGHEIRVRRVFGTD